MKVSALSVDLLAIITFPLVLGAAPIKNDGLIADLLIPDTYIVKYKTNVDSIRRTAHEEDIDSRARNASRRGIFDKFNIPGLQGYAAEVPPSELILLTDCDLVGFPFSPSHPTVNLTLPRSITSNATPSSKPPTPPPPPSPSAR
jgi:hypothetical protein